MRAGDLIVPHAVILDRTTYAADPALAAFFGSFTGHTLLAGSAIVATSAEKRALFACTGAQAIDLESGSVARLARERNVPFAVIRAVCDPAERDLPAAALIALDTKGAIGLSRVLRSVLRRPGQIPALLAVARDAALARRTLVGACSDKR